jgi:hypothetical protein
MSKDVVQYIPQPNALAERDFNSLDDLVDAYMEAGALTDDDRALIELLLEPDARLDLVVPENPDPEQVWQQLDVCARVHGALIRGEFALKPVIAQLLKVIQRNPVMFESKGYKTFTDFIVQWVPKNLRISRPEAWKIKCVAERFPSLTPRKTLEIGYGKLIAMSRQMDERHPSFERLCKIAPTVTSDQFYRILAEEAKRDSKEDTPTNIRVKANIATWELWEEFRSNKYVQAVCETSNPGAIFLAMMQECYTEWVALGREKMALERQAKREMLAGEKQQRKPKPSPDTELGGMANAIDAELLGVE